jgi:hypothetical protein
VYAIALKEVLDGLLVFSWCSSNYDVTFKITVEFEIIIIDIYSIGDFKNYITVVKTLKEQLAFSYLIIACML